jgi:hypothetical protein
MHPGQASHDPPISGLGARGWTVEEAATELADRDRGYDLATARAMIEEYLAGVAGGPQNVTLAGDVRLDDLDIDVIIALTDNDISLEYGFATFEEYVDLPDGHVVDAAVIGDTPDAAPTGRDRGQPADAVYTDTVDGYGGWSPELMSRITDASSAVAARDGAMEVGDLSAAAAFADQAREAIAKAVVAGIELPELADELDYPGGHTAMDGPHIDQPAVTASHGLVFDSGTGPSPPGGAHSHAMADIRAEFDQAHAAARTAGENQRADAGEEIVSAGGAQVGYGGLAGGTAWVVADDQTAAPQHMAGGYDTA